MIFRRSNPNAGVRVKQVNSKDWALQLLSGGSSAGQTAFDWIPFSSLDFDETSRGPRLGVSQHEPHTFSSLIECHTAFHPAQTAGMKPFSMSRL